MRFAATTIAIATAFLALASASPDLVVDTKFGQLRGADEGTYSAFKGVPYAASTAGENRWTAPKDPEPWEDVRDATEYRSICPQAADGGSAFFEEFSEVLGVESPAPPNFTISEDCLVLNVFTPSLNGSAPVMVWIHGGALVTGAGEQYPADGLVSHDVVVVTINYRLGFLGYFAHPDLQDTNFGLLDQVKALEWVQENIAQFGGDPNQVTIFGESAGGVSVLALTVSPLAEGLFRGAIAQSSAIMESLNVTREEAGDLGVAVGNFVNATGIPLYGISQISQMRSVPAEAYLEAMQAFQVSPAGPMAFLYKDNKSLPVSVYEGFQTGAQHQGVNMMIGMNENETTPFLMQINATSPITTESYTTFVDNAFGTNESDVQIVMENIPANSDEDAFAAYTELWTDLFFGSSSFGVAQGSASSGASTWFYMFDYEYEAAPMLGAYHAIEIPFALNTTSFITPMGNVALGSAMVRYWTNFAKTGNPNQPDTASLPNWPAFEEGSDSWQVLGDEISNQPIPESRMEVYALGKTLYPPSILGSFGPLYGTNYTWSPEDGVPAGPQA